MKRANSSLRNRKGKANIAVKLGLNPSEKEGQIPVGGGGIALLVLYHHLLLSRAEQKDINILQAQKHSSSYTV